MNILDFNEKRGFSILSIDSFDIVKEYETESEPVKCIKLDGRFCALSMKKDAAGAYDGIICARYKYESGFDRWLKKQYDNYRLVR